MLRPALAAAIVLQSSFAASEPPLFLSEIAIGAGGFIMNGRSVLDRAGYSLAAAGDVNGDGLPDIVVGAKGPDPNLVSTAGEAYVVFGRTATTPVDLPQANGGATGFAIYGFVPFGYAGIKVDGGGDINGDGRDDVIVGSQYMGLTEVIAAGQSYVVFGKTSGAAVSLSDVNAGTGGFSINGATDGDNAGTDVAIAGDVNDDGRDDLLIGARNADVGGNADAGRAYVVFGKTSGTAVDLANVESGTGGFVINGVAAGDTAGWSVAGIGDVNGDNFADVAVSAPRRDPDGRTDAGAVYVIFGKSSTAAVNLSIIENASGGFLIKGIDNFDSIGICVEGAGDVNGDGRDDIILGAQLANGQRGEAYVVFGKSSTTAVDLSNVAAGSGGFIINGIDVFDRIGYSVAGAGDVNGDDFADIVVGSRGSDGAAGVNMTGETYVIFGKSDTLPVNASDVVAGSGGFVIYGIDGGDYSGHSVSAAGDINDDGLDDVLVGAPFASPNGANSGEAYVIHGRPTARLRVGIQDFVTGNPITSATLLVQRTDATVGFEGVFAGLEEEAVYETRLADGVDYVVRASAPGYEPSEPLFVRPQKSSSPVATIELTPDPDLAATNTVRVQIVVLDENLDPTDALLLTDTVQLRQGGIDIGLNPIFGSGEMVFLGVPSESLEVFVPDTGNFTFSEANVTLGTGVTELVTLTAFLIDPVPRTSGPQPPRAELPGQIVGSVVNTGAPTPSGLADAILVAENEASGISITTRAAANGAFFFPDALTGPGQLKAFSPDGAIAGTIRPVAIVAGQIYGDEPATEITDMEVLMPRTATGDTGNDSDFDGLPNGFETTYFDATVPLDQRGPNDDPDGDGLTNYGEFLAGTDPTLIDTDGDGVPDGVEHVLGSNPLLPNSVPTPPEPVWVDFGFTGNLQAGTLDKPYSTLEAAVSAAANGGTVRIKGDVADISGDAPASAVSKPITLEAFRGIVRID